MKITIALACGLYICLSPFSRAQSSSKLDHQLNTIDAIPSNSKLLRDDDAFKAAVEGCLTPAAKTEFDTIETQLQRARSAPCTFTGVVTIKGKADSRNGDLLSYDPQKEVILFRVPLKRLENLVHGLEAASPYDPEFHKNDEKGLSTDQKNAVKAAGKADYLLFSVTSSDDAMKAYAAQNGFGAKVSVTELRGLRYDIAVNVGVHPPFDDRPVDFLVLPMKRAAASTTLQNLDVKLYWIAAPPCELCFPAGSVVRGNLGPTYDQPTTSSSFIGLSSPDWSEFGSLTGVMETWWFHTRV